MYKGILKIKCGIKLLSLAVVALMTVSAVLPCSAALDDGLDAVQGEQGTKLYVSPLGSDSGSGRIDDPFATVAAARDAVRSMRDSVTGGVTVYLREGIYVQESTLEFDEKDSGSKDFPITYKAYEGETAIIEGGIVLDSSKFYRPDANDAYASRILDETAREKVVVYDLKDEKIDLSDIQPTAENPGLSLYYGGERGTLARYPNEQYILAFHDLDHKNEDSYMCDPTKGTFYDKTNTVSKWRSVEGAQVAGNFEIDWEQTYPVDIASYDPETNRVKLKSPSGLSGMSGYSGRYYYTNVIEEMDMVGEYYVDTQNGLLYFYAPDNLADITVSIGGCKNTVVSARVSNYTFYGLTFEGGYDNNIVISGDNITFDRCTVRCCGGNGIKFTGNALTIKNSEIYRIGRTAVILNGGNLVTLIPSRSVITNNKIHDFGDISRTYAGAIDMYGSGFEISHNEIYHAPHTSIQNIACDFAVEYNYFHDLCYEAGDAGAIYDGGWFSNGNCYRHNLFKDIVNTTSPYYRPNAYYCDGGGGGKNVYSNIFINVDGYGVYCGGRDIKILDNIFVNTSVHYDQCTYYPGAGVNSGYTLTAMFPVSPTIADNTGLNWKMRVLEPGASGYGTENWAIRFTYLGLMKTTNVVDLNDNFVPYAFGDSRIRNNVFAGTGSTEIYENVERLANIRDNMTCSVDKIAFADYYGGDYTVTEDSLIYHDIPGFKACDFSQIGVQSEN